MKYHVYQYGTGCRWMETQQEAVDLFTSLPTDGRFASIGITQGSYALDVIIKGEYTRGQAFLLSQDIRQSDLFKEDPQTVIETVKELYEAVGIDPEVNGPIIKELKTLAQRFKREADVTEGEDKGNDMDADNDDELEME